MPKSKRSAPASVAPPNPRASADAAYLRARGWTPIPSSPNHWSHPHHLPSRPTPFTLSSALAHQRLLDAGAVCDCPSSPR